MAKSNVIPITILKPTASNTAINQAEHSIIYINPEDEQVLVQVLDRRIPLVTWIEAIENRGYTKGYWDAARQWIALLLITVAVFIQIVFVIVMYKPSYYHTEDPKKGKLTYKLIESSQYIDLTLIP